jgi:hypothetical protein
MTCITIHEGAACEAEPDFHFLGDTPCCEQDLPNASGMGVVTLGPASSPKANDGEFISSRQLTQAELAVEWAQHNARHGKTR